MRIPFALLGLSLIFHSISVHADDLHEKLPADLNFEVYSHFSLSELFSLSSTSKTYQEDVTELTTRSSRPFFKRAKLNWLSQGDFKSLVLFPTIRILNEIRDNYLNAKWRALAVNDLLDLETQFAEVPASKFKMGSHAAIDPTGDNDETEHWVGLDAYWIQRTQVTQLLYFLVRLENPSYFNMSEHCPGDHIVVGHIPLCPRNPVEQVSWKSIENQREAEYEAGPFLQALHDLFKTELNKEVKLRLPTEAEWERAARGDLNYPSFYQPYSFGEAGNHTSILKEYSWFGANSTGRTHRVAMKKTNSLGLFDMNGNVWEWVQDWYHEQYNPSDEMNPVKNPQGPTGGFHRGLRGGAWFSINPDCLRSAHRYFSTEDSKSHVTGFRLVRSR